MADKTFADWMWGETRSPDIEERLRGFDELTQPDAQILLDAVVHPETRRVIDVLQAQMAKKAPYAQYSTEMDPVNGRNYAAAQVSFVPIAKTLLFSDDFLHGGYTAIVEALIEKAHPRYEPISASIGSMGFVLK